MGSNDQGQTQPDYPIVELRPSAGSKTFPDDVRGTSIPDLRRHPVIGDIIRTVHTHHLTLLGQSCSHRSLSTDDESDNVCIHMRAHLPHLVRTCRPTHCNAIIEIKADVLS